MDEMMGRLRNALIMASYAQADAEKVRVVCEDLGQEFFILRGQDDDEEKWDIMRFEFDAAGVRNDIMGDYIAQLEKKLTALYTQIEAIHDDLRKAIPITIPMVDLTAGKDILLDGEQDAGEDSNE